MKWLVVLLAFFIAPQAHAFTKSVQFNGSAQYLSRASFVYPTGAMTCEGWAYFDSTPSVLGSICASPTSAGNRSFFFDLRPAGFCDYSAGGCLYLVIYGATASSTEVAYTVPTGAWHHYAVAYNDSANTVKFYVDGTQQGVTQTNNNSLPSLTNTLYFGNTASNYFAGNLSNMKMWSTERSQAEITSDMCATLGATTGLLGEWSLDDVLTDNSGNGYTLTNNGSATFVSEVPVCAVAEVAKSILSLVRSMWIF